MAFVEKIIGPDEKLIGVSTIHWSYGAIGVLWMGLLVALGLYINTYSMALNKNFPHNPGLIATNLMSNSILIMCSLLGFILCALYLTMMATTEVALTTKRIIYKRGWIFVKVNEADLEEIKAAGVNNGWFGRILNYGYIDLDARFIKSMNFPAIADPYRFVKAVNERRSHLKHDSMHGTLEGHREHNAEEPQKKSKKKKKAKKEKKEMTPSLQDERYSALSNVPAENMKDFVKDTRQTFDARNEANLAQYMPPESAIHPAPPPPLPTAVAGPSEQAPMMSPNPTPPPQEIPEQRPQETPAPVAPTPTPEQAPPQVPNEVPQPSNPIPEQAPPPQGAAAAQQKSAQPLPVKLATSQPIIFDRENLRDELKERLLDDFSESEQGRA